MLMKSGRQCVNAMKMLMRSRGVVNGISFDLQKQTSSMLAENRQVLGLVSSITT